MHRVEHDARRLSWLRQSSLENEGLENVNGIFMFDVVALDVDMYEGCVLVIIANNSRLTGSYHDVFIKDEITCALGSLFTMDHFGG